MLEVFSGFRRGEGVYGCGCMGCLDWMNRLKR